MRQILKLYITTISDLPEPSIAISHQWSTSGLKENLTFFVAPGFGFYNFLSDSFHQWNTEVH